MSEHDFPAAGLQAHPLAEGLHTGRLPNGLRVVIRRDPRSAVAVCNVWVGVGSNREPEALRGWSHGIEHMLFKGTARRGESDFALEVAAAGGSTNAGTGYETTNYHITAPAASLPTAIDILGDALLQSTFDAASLDAERQVLVHENHMYDDIPFGFGVTWRWGLELAFDDSPYRHPIGGRDENLLQCPRERILRFWRSAYHPANMVAAVVGDIDPQDTFALLEAAFGKAVPADMNDGAEARDLIVPEPPREPRRHEPRLRVETGDLQKAYAKLVFTAPGESSGFEPVLSVVKRVLNDGRTCRLYRRLQEELKLVDDYAVMTETGPREGVILVDLETSVDRLAAAVRECARILGDLGRDGCTPDEIERAVRRTARGHLFGLETVQGQASSLGHHALFDDLAGAFAFPARVAAVTAADVTGYARDVFRLGNLACVLYLPRATNVAEAGLPLAADGLATLLDGALPGDDCAPATPPYRPATPAARKRGAPAAHAPRFESETLPDGSSLHCRIDRAVPVAALAIAVRGGAGGETALDAGLASLTHQALLRGAAGLSAERFHELVEDDGASLGAIVDRDYGGLYLTALADRLEPALTRLVEAITEPTFAPLELEQEKRLAREQMAAVADNPLQSSMLRLRAMLYGDHPYGRPLPGTVESLAVIGRDQVVARHAAAWTAGRLQVVVSGDIDPAHIRRVVTDLAGRLPRPGALPPLPGAMRDFAGVESERLTRAQNQTVVLLGWPGPVGDDADRVPLMLMRQVLNGQSGRLFENLRNRQSLCYNAGFVGTSGFGQGLLVGYVLTAPATADQARTALCSELTGLAEGLVGDAELERARTELAGGLLIAGQSNAARVTRAQRDVMYGRNADDMIDLVDRITGCTAAEIRDAAARYLLPDRHAEVTLGPA
jgi:zinc protease